MNYINTKFLSSSGFTWDDAYTLLLIKQGQAEELEKEWTEKLLEVGLIKLIKPKNKAESELSRLRLDKKGREFLEKLSEAEIEEEDNRVLIWLSDLYKSLGKEIGSKNKTLYYLKEFRVKSGIDKNKLVNLITVLTNDENQMEWSKVLQYLIFKPQNVYNTKFNLDESKLWNYYLKHQNYFDKEWEKEKYQN